MDTQDKFDFGEESLTPRYDRAIAAINEASEHARDDIEACTDVKALVDFIKKMMDAERKIIEIRIRAERNTGRLLRADRRALRAAMIAQMAAATGGAR